MQLILRLAAFEAAESKNPEAVFAVGEQIYNACDTCHVLSSYEEADAVIREQHQAARFGLFSADSSRRALTLP